ncbi:hypothetical protein B0T16DRAFT_96462 [Cercophora newfieldiana]|uniref:Uncharacterized protein n=1 Tax=Cercophora newfieldiana TaxID=92897 RepID=A0AA39YGM4_9PEZI|nr:hypothetical protein B0T16DRAFT_96462 [Cercophora newfieldiana]
MRLWPTIRAPGGFSELQSSAGRGPAPMLSHTDARAIRDLGRDKKNVGCTEHFSCCVHRHEEASRGQDGFSSFREMVVDILGRAGRSSGKRQVAAATHSWTHQLRESKRGGQSDIGHIVLQSRFLSGGQGFFEFPACYAQQKYSYSYCVRMRGTRRGTRVEQWRSSAFSSALDRSCLRDSYITSDEAVMCVGADQWLALGGALRQPRRLDAWRPCRCRDSLSCSMQMRFSAVPHNRILGLGGCLGF